VRDPYRHGGVEQDEEVAHTHIDTRASKAGIEDAEGDASCGETSTSGDISSATKGQIAQDGV